MELTVIEIPEFQPVIKLSGIEKANTYAAIFAPFMINVKELSEKVGGINKENPTEIDSKIARDVRLQLVKNRTATGKKKDEAKASLLSEGSLIQNLHNVVVATSELIEAELTQIEKFAEIKEAERVKALHAERLEIMQPYIENYIGVDFGKMEQSQFDNIFEGAKLAHEQKIEAARLAEEKRLAEEAAARIEQERIRRENEALKAEAEAKEKQLAAERAENSAKLAAIEAANNAAREKAAKELKAANDAASELRAEQQRLAKIEADRIAAEKKAAKAPVKVKMKTAIDNLELTLPESQITEDIMTKFLGFKKWALSQIEAI
jgi:hypothetical protein